jgi:Flp pilus assembly protein TadB
MTLQSSARRQGRTAPSQRERLTQALLPGPAQPTPRALAPVRWRRFGPAEPRARRNRGRRRFRRRAEAASRAGGVGRAVVGVGLVTAALLVGVMPGLVGVGVAVVGAWPVAGWVARRHAAKRRLAMQSEAAPAVLDLLGAALLAGLNPHKAILRIADRAPEALQEDLGLAAAVLRLGGTPAAALRAAADRSGLDELRAAAAALEAAERWGAPPAEALAARAEALRSRTRLQAEAEAGRAAVRLAFPLVLCFLPAFVLLTVVPTVAGSLRALTP